MPEPLRTLVVDDEPVARRRLRRMLAAHADVVIVGEAEDAPAAVRAARDLAPDLVLLDVRLPGGDGLAVARALAAAGPAPAPFVVFVTAYAAAAVAAFDAEAVDFLLKPYDAERLARSLARARAARDRAARERAPAAAPAPGPWRERFVVTVGRRTRLVPVDAVEWIEADDNYAVLHAGAERHLVRATLRALEGELDPARWVRVHRSAIVRLDRVRELVARPDGEWRAVLASGTVVPVGATYRARLPRG